MKKLILIVTSILLVAGCMNKSASDAVKSYLGQYQNLSENVLKDLDKLTDEQTLTEDQKSVYKEIMRKQYQDLKYEIVGENYDGDSATVTTKITVYDLYKVQKDAEDYMMNNMKEFYDESNVYDNTTYLNYKLDKMKNYTEEVSYTLEFNLVKENKDWVVVQPSEEDLQKIHGIYNYEEE